MDRNEFLLRRLHSLTGVIPVGVFLIEHLFTNSLAALSNGAETFNEHVHWLHELPYLLILEIVGIWAPLAFHGLYGIYIARTGKSNTSAYPYADNWRYTLQRLTGYIAAVFIVTHLIHFRFAYLFGGAMYVGAADPFEITRQGFANGSLPAPILGAWYVIGTFAATYHFCNGLATFCITWGITVGDVARRRVSGAFAVLGVVLMVWGLMSLRAFQIAPAPQDADEANLAQVDNGNVQAAELARAEEQSPKP
jgi:succinate dehydrogenase / fumarate reductase cytochrome b subunit